VVRFAITDWELLMLNKKGPAVFATALCFAGAAQAGVQLIAIGTIDAHIEDRSSATTAPLENAVAGNRLGGMGSALAYAGGTTFLALPDRGPNANPYNPLIDDTVSYIPRFHTIDLRLSPSDPGSALPFTLTPTMLDTTLLSSATPLVYGTGAGLGYQADGATPLGSGAPALNAVEHRFYFSGRSDNFDATQPSTSQNNARLDPEGIRVSNNGRVVYVSDEYGPYVHQFNRATGIRARSFALPANLAITKLSPHKDVEIDGNTVGRVTNKGMEGLAITPSGNLLVGAMQANLEQDKKNSLRIVTIDTRSGATREYAYKLTKGSGISEIVAVNEHQFLVDERDGSGFADTPRLTDTASAAKEKRLFLIDLAGAADISNVAGGDLSSYAVPKMEFLDVVAALTGAGIDPLYIPSKIEGVAFGPDVTVGGETRHTLYVANDNDFLAEVADPTKAPGDSTRGMVPNPNTIYVFAFTDADLPGYVPQPLREASRLPGCLLGGE
jgi:hypothetical protein